jgi:hypothetical protein
MNDDAATLAVAGETPSDYVAFKPDIPPIPCDACGANMVEPNQVPNQPTGAVISGIGWHWPGGSPHDFMICPACFKRTMLWAAAEAARIERRDQGRIERENS